jgi:hypothetical protein
MSCNYSSTIVAVIVVLFKFRKLKKGMFFDGYWRTVEFPNETVVLSKNLHLLQERTIS